MGVRVEHRNPNEYRKGFARLSPDAQAFVAAEVELLAVRWPVGMPRVRDLRGGLCELRISGFGGLRLYFEVAEDVIAFVTYGRKDTQQRDIDRARRRLT